MNSPGLVALSLTKTIKAYPAVGWVRGNTIASAETLTEINQLRKANDVLRAKLDDATPNADLDLAHLDEAFSFTVQPSGGQESQLFQLTWQEIFLLIAINLLHGPRIEYSIGHDVATKLLSGLPDQRFAAVFVKDLETMRFQFEAQGLVTLDYRDPDIDYDDPYVLWQITTRGENLLKSSRTVKTQKNS